MAKKYKLGYSEGLDSLITYIKTSEKYITWVELIQFSVDYDIYVDLYMNLNIIDRVMYEKNIQFTKSV